MSTVIKWNNIEYIVLYKLIQSIQPHICSQFNLTLKLWLVSLKLLFLKLINLFYSNKFITTHYSNKFSTTQEIFTL